MNASTKRLEMESQKMEKRLEQLKLSLKKEKEERRLTARWKSTDPGAPEILRKTAQANAHLMTQKAANVRWKILGDLKIKSKSSTVTSISKMTKTVSAGRPAPSSTKPLSSSIKDANLPSKTTLKNHPQSSQQCSTVANGSLCDQCESRRGEQRCIDCSLLYCRACWLTFHSKGQLKNHLYQAVDLTTSVTASAKQHTADGAGSVAKEKTPSQVVPKQQPYLPPANSLLRGYYDEEESTRSFQEAVQLWRSSQEQALEKANERKSREVVTEKETESLPQKEPEKVDTAEISTATTTNRLPPPVEIRFSDDSPYRYHEWLLSQRPKLVQLELDAVDSSKTYVASQNLRAVPAKQLDSEKVTPDVLPEDVQEKTLTPDKSSAEDVVKESKAARLNGLVDFVPVCSAAAEAAKKRLMPNVKSRLEEVSRTTEKSPEAIGVWKQPQVEEKLLDTCKKDVANCDVVLTSGTGVEVKLIESILNPPELSLEATRDPEENWVVFPVPTSDLEEMRQNRRLRAGTRGNSVTFATESSSLARPEIREPSPPSVVINGNSGDVFLSHRKGNSPMAPLSPSPRKISNGQMKPTIEITPLFGFEGSGRFPTSPRVSPMKLSPDSSWSASPNSLPSLSPNRLSASPMSGSGSSRSPSPHFSRSPSPRRPSVSVNNESHVPLRSLSPLPLSPRPPSPRLQRSGYQYLRVSRLEKAKNKDANKNGIISTQNGAKPTSVKDNVAKTLSTAEKRVSDDAKARDLTRRNASLRPRDALVTTEQMSNSRLDSTKNDEIVKDEQDTTRNDNSAPNTTNGFDFKLGPNTWNPAESILSPNFPEIEEKIKCIDFGINDYLSAEVKESDEDSSGSGDFNNGLKVEPRSLFVETDLDSPLPLFEDLLDNKKNKQRRPSGFLRGGSDDDSTLDEDVGPVADMYVADDSEGENDSNTESDGSFSPVDSTLGSLAERDAEDEETMESLERELGQLTGQDKVDTEDIVNRLMRLDSQDLAGMDPYQVDAALSIAEDIGQGSGLSSPMSDSDEDAKMVETLK